MVLPSYLNSSALLLAEHTAHPACPLAGLPGRPGTPEIPQKYKNTVLVLWKPAESKAPCTYTLERRLDGRWGCRPTPRRSSLKVGLRDTKPRKKCLKSLLSPGARWGPESGVGDRVLPLACPHLILPLMLTGEHEWKIVSTGITDCYFNVTELPPGSAAKFRVACVNKAGQGPYSTPSAKVHLEAAGKRALSCGVWSLWDLESSGIFSSGIWGMGCHLHPSPCLLPPWLVSHFAPCRCPSCPSEGQCCPCP